MKKFYIGRTVKVANLDILRLKQEIRDAEAAIQDTINSHITTVCVTDPEFVEWSNTLKVPMSTVVNVLGPKREQVLWSWLNNNATKSGYNDLIDTLEEHGFLTRTYYYDASHLGCGDERIGAEEEKNFYKCDNGMWACPVRGEEITQEEFDEQTYPLFSTTDIYHNLWDKISSGVDSLIVIE